MRKDPYAHAPRLPEGDPLDPAQLLTADGSDVELEIGPARGTFMIGRLEAVPDLKMVGLEIRRKWATLADERLRRRGLGCRGRVFAEDARSALRRLAPRRLSAIHVNFPDPWWKKRHQKRLLLTPELILELARLLKPGGELFLQTDVEERAETYEATISASGGFVPCEGGPRVSDHPHQSRSLRERQSIEAGIPVYRLRFRSVG